MSQSKFIIDGKIEGNSETISPRQRPNQEIVRLKAWVLVLSIVSMVFLALAFYLFVKNDNMSSEMLTLKAKVNRVDEILDKNSALEVSKDSLLKNAVKSSVEKAELYDDNRSDHGVFFEVQLGNIKDLNTKGLSKEKVTLYLQESGAGNKYSIGSFVSFKKALEFEEEMKKLGLKSAFLVGRIDGKLVDYEEALSQIQVDPKAGK